MKKERHDHITLLSQGDILSDVTEWIPTGFDEFDYILGGGWAVGRCSEVYGPEGVGKTALAHAAIRENQRMGGLPAIVDAETALTKKVMEQLGIDPKRLIYISPEFVEEAWDIVWAWMDELEKRHPPVPSLLAWDSVAASVPKAEVEEASADKSHIGLLAKAMSKGCRKMYRRIAKVRAHVMFINQERSAIGGGPFEEKKTVGGDMVRYAASQRIRLAKVATLKEGPKDAQLATGYLVRGITKKSRLFPPQRRATYVLDFKHGPSPELTLLQRLTELRVVTGTKAGYVAPWFPEKFKSSDWLTLCQDKSFLNDARDAFKARFAGIHTLDGETLSDGEATEVAESAESEDGD